MTVKARKKTPYLLGGVRETPILFGAPMVRAILDRGKSQTRRLVKPLTGTQMRISGQPCPFGRAGDRLWVRETWYQNAVTGEYYYRADRPDPDQPPVIAPLADVVRAAWKPSIFMPREACRIELQITATRLESVQSLTAADAIAEGIYPDSAGRFWSYGNGWHATPLIAYADLWETINPDDPWDTNPSVWVVTFERRDVG